ncbi:hypothetical protein B0533_10375 [Sedimentibacter sp. SX930]|nr:hypothetical protein B0533_10375 [Sedimentibacter sp. SX930]
MAVIEQKLSKVAHPLYADADEDATNNCIRYYFSMSRPKEEQPAGLSSGEGCLVEDGVPFFSPFSGGAGFIGDACRFSVLFSGEMVAPRRYGSPQKQKK